MEGISEKHIERALEYLRDQAEPMARAKAGMVRWDHQRKVVRGQAFLAADGTVGEREARAECSADYRECLERLAEATHEYEVIRARMKAAELKIEVFRTMQASSRRGHV